MKKIISLILAAVLVFGLAACGGSAVREPGPDEIVKVFCEALTDLDLEAMAACMDGVSADELKEFTLDLSEENGEFFVDFIKEKAANINYTVGNTLASADGEHKTVIVDFEYEDCSEIISNTMENFVWQLFGLMLSSSVSEEELEAETMKAFEDCLNDAVSEIEPGEATAKIEFDCVKTEEGWKIAELPEGFADVMTANMYSVLNGESGDYDLEDDSSLDPEEDEEDDPFGGEGEWDGYAPDFSDYTMANVACGNSAVVNGLRITVESCTELDYVSGIGSPASGNKFVQYMLKIENESAEDELFFDDGVMDSEGNYYVQSYDAMDLDISGKIIDAGETIEGTITYEMPAEASSYYMLIVDYMNSTGAKFYGEY